MSSNLDYLRSLAVLLVFADHFALTAGASKKYFGFLGSIGVALFFVHTSLVLLMSLTRDPSPARFYVRRAFRIYPLAAVLVIGATLLRLPERPWDGIRWTQPSIPTLWANLLLIQNLTGAPSLLTQLWSLPIELDMYLVLPLIFVVARRLAALRPADRGPSAIGLWMLSAVVMGGVYSVWPHMEALSVPCFLAGMVAWTGRGKLRPLASAFWICGLPVAVLATWLTAINYPQWQMPAWWLLCLLTALFWTLSREVRLTPLKRSAEWIAQYSYGIYLLHIPALWIASLICPAQYFWWLGLGISTALTMLLSVIAYHAIERPFIQLGRALAASVSAVPNSVLRMAGPTQSSSATR